MPGYHNRSTNYARLDLDLFTPLTIQRALWMVSSAAIPACRLLLRAGAAFFLGAVFFFGAAFVFFFPHLQCASARPACEVFFFANALPACEHFALFISLSMHISHVT
eukprot:COSAG02_NODE_27172_length_615_cov_1.467054_2_plen_107_part_00